MKEIQNFLESLAVDSSNPDEDRLVNMYYTKPRQVNHHVKCALVVKASTYINNILIPFFDGLTFFSKKRLDYED
jgi:hypothetical protein